MERKEKMDSLLDLYHINRQISAMTTTSKKLRSLRNAVEENDANQGKLGPGEFNQKRERELDGMISMDQAE